MEDTICKIPDTLKSIYKIIKINSSRPNDRYLYVFIGNIDQNIDKILQKNIKNNYIFTQKEQNELQNIYGKNYYNKLGCNIKDISAVFYIKELIFGDDTINIIKKKIITYISYSSEILINNKIHIWCIKNSQYSMSPHSNSIYNLFYKLSKDKEFIDKEYLISHIKNISPTTISINTKSDKIDIHDFIKNKIYVLFLKEYTILGYNYYNEYGNIYIDPNPYHIQDVTDLPGDEGKLILKSHEVLDDYGIIENNIIYMATLDDYIKNNKSKIVDDIVLKYWPYSKINDDSTSNKEYNDTVDIIHKTSEVTGLITDTYYKYVYKTPETLTHVQSCYITHMKIINNNNIVNDFSIDILSLLEVVNIKNVFNTIALNVNIPFVILLYNDLTRYKISKEFIKKRNIDESNLKKWILHKKKYNNINYILYTLFLNDDLHKSVDILIYENSKVEIKLKSDETVGYNYTDIQKIIKIVNNFINHVNNVCGIKLYVIDKNIVQNKDIQNIRISTILKINSDKEIVLTSFKQFLENFFPYINLIEDNTLLHFKYKRISNYVKMDEIGETINRHFDKSKNDIIKILIKNFELNEREAILEYEKWTSNLKLELHKDGNMGNKKYFFIPKIQSGIDVKINKIDIKNLKIDIEGAKQIKNIHSILKFLKSVIYLFIHKNDISVDLSNILKKYIKIKSKSDLFDKYDDAGMSKGEEEFINLVEEDKKKLFIFDDEDDDDDFLNLLNNNTNISNTRNTSNKINVGIEDMSNDDNELDELDKDLNKLYTLNRLYNADKTLFNLKTEKFSRICQKERQPIVITTDEKNNIDKNYKDTYTNAINYGSTTEKKNNNWYICPEVWCIRCRISMTNDMFIKSNNTCIKCGGIKIDEVKKKNIDVDSNKTVIVFNRKSHVYASFLNRKRNPHPKDLCMPCCFKTSPEKPGLLKENNKECLEGKIEEEVKPDTSLHYKYIKGKKIPTESGRYGILNESLHKIFGLDLSKCGENGGTGMLVNNPDCILRKGIVHESQSSFLSAISDILNYESSQNIIDIIIKKINLDLFRSLNDGSLFLNFLNNTQRSHDSDFNNLDLSRIRKLIEKYIPYFKNSEFNDIFNKDTQYKKDILSLYFKSLHNYIEYLKNDNIHKDHVFLQDIISRENIITEKGLNIIIIETIGEESSILYPIGNIIDNFKKNRNTVIVHKQGEYYEPIVSLYKDSITGELKNINEYNYNNTTTHIKNFLNLYIGYSGYYSNDEKNPLEYNTLYNLVRTIKKYSISHTVIDIYNKVVAVIIHDMNTDKNYCICIKNRNIIINRSLGSLYPLILYDDIWDKIKLANSEDTLSFIDNLKKYKIHIDITSIVKDSNNIIYGLLIDGLNTICPIKKEKYVVKQKYKVDIITIDIQTVLNYKIMLQEKNSNERVMYIERKIYENNAYERLKYEISELLKHKKQYKEKIYGIIENVTLKNNDKRQKIYRVLEEIIQFFGIYSKDRVDLTITNKEKKENTKNICSRNTNKKTCDNDIFCKWDNNKCYFNIDSDRYIYVLGGELLRNYIVREQILKSKISKMYNTSTITTNNDEYIYTNTNIMLGNIIEPLREFKSIKKIKIINNLYTSSHNIRTDDNSIALDSRCMYTKDVLPSKWQRYFGINKFSILNDGDNPLCGYFMVTCILNNANIDSNIIYNIETVKNILYRYIENLNNDEKKELFNQYINKRNDKFKNIKIDDIINDDNIIKKNILQDDAILSELELEIISEIFGIRIIIIGNIKKTNPEGIKCINRDEKSDIIVLLNQISGKDKNYDTFKIIQKNKNKKFVFNEYDFKNTKTEKDKNFIELMNRICIKKSFNI